MSSSTMPHLALRVDHEARYVSISSALAELIGRDSASLVGQPIAEVDLPHDLSPQWDRACRAVLETGSPVTVTCILRTPSGPQHWQLTFYADLAGDGTPCAVSAIAQETHDDAESAEPEPLAVQEYLCDVLDHSRDLIYRLNLRTGTYDYLSQSAEAITGFPSAALLKMGIEGIAARVHPADRGRFLENTGALITGYRDQDEVIEYRFCHASGEYHWLSDSRTVVRDDRGAAVALAGSLRDVTQQQRIQSKQARLLEDLVTSRERLEQVIQQMPIGVTIADATTGFLIVANEEARRIFGRPNGDMVGRSGGVIDGARHPDGRPLVAEEYPQARSLREGEVVRGEEVRYCSGDGVELALSVTSAPIYDQERHVIAAVSTYADITDSKRIEEERRDSEYRFRAAIDHFPGILAIYDADRRIQFINGAGVRLSGRPEDEVLGRRDDEVFPPEVAAQYQHLLSQALTTGAVQRIEQTLPDSMGGRTFVREFVPLPDAGGSPRQLLSVAYDITQRREVERQLEELNCTLERRVFERTAQLRALASELVDVEQRERRRLAQMLHDHLQQLLVAARINASVLLKEVSGDALRQPLEQLDELLDQSLQTSRSLTVELSPPVLYDLGLAAALHWLARWMLEKHGLIVEVEADDEADPKTDSMRVLLFGAARELLFNVVKHAGVSAARMRLWRHDDGIWLSVTDNGVGLGARQGSAPATGSGFGLFSIRERLDSLGGGLEIDSAPGRGTCVRLRAPLHKSDSEVIAAGTAGARGPVPDEANTEADGGGDGLRILLADDHAILRQGLASMLRAQPDLEVVGEAADGREAVELARSLEPDVVLMDVSMPQMDGVEATRHIKGELAAIHVIGLSMHDEADVSARMHAAGACAYVTKSGDTAVLLAAIRKCRDVSRPALTLAAERPTIT